MSISAQELCNLEVVDFKGLLYNVLRIDLRDDGCYVTCRPKYEYEPENKRFTSNVDNVILKINREDWKKSECIPNTSEYDVYQFLMENGSKIREH